MRDTNPGRTESALGRTEAETTAPRASLDSRRGRRRRDLDHLRAPSARASVAHHVGRSRPGTARRRGDVDGPRHDSRRDAPEARERVDHLRDVFRRRRERRRKHGPHRRQSVPGPARTVHQRNGGWFVVSAVSGSEGPVISSQMTLDVGTVVRNGPSGIAIAQVTRIPTNPDPLDIVVVTAQVTSQSTMLQVSFSYMAFYRNGQGSGGGSMIKDTSGNWTTGGMFVAPVMPRFSGTVFYYRIAAIDGTQNTATSAVYNYTLR